MPHPQIKFGTDGWRGLIADDFTFSNVRIAAQAVAAYLHSRSGSDKEDPAQGICIGYDSRFGSKAFARACAEVVAATGIPVQLANDITPTPALSFGVRERSAAGGIMITSSHNPAQWNGVKYKAWNGGSGKPSIIAEIESYLGAPVAFATQLPRIGVDHVQIRGNTAPLSPGINPEPIEPHIRALGDATVANHCDAGVCTD